MAFFRRLFTRKHTTAARLLARPAVEALESRLAPYAGSGNAWPVPQLITIGFVPDGTVLAQGGNGGVTSNLIGAFNARWPQAGWQNVILKAAQTWAAQTNINFALVGDGGGSIGSGLYQQGDPSMADIRIGGFNFGTTTLAQAFMPPPVNNFSLAGDIDFNTGQSFNIGTTYDLYTVALHEFGHALGLAHSSAGTSAVMYPTYNGARSGLSSDDAAGIRSLYSGNNPRSPDAFDAAGGNNSFATATNLSSAINPTTLTALVSNLDLTTPSDADYYTFTVPAGTTRQATITVRSAGLSLLAPNLTVYAANQTTILGSALGTSQYGTTVSVTLNNVSAGQVLYFKVQGAESTVFGTGAYALTLNVGSGATPAVPMPSTQVANGPVLNAGGGTLENSDDYLDSVPIITGISLDSGVSSNDAVTNDQRLVLAGAAETGTTVQVFLNGTLIGSSVARDNKWTFDYTSCLLADGTYAFTAQGTDTSGLVSGLSQPYAVTVDTRAPAAPVVTGFGPDSGVAGDGLTSAQAPTLTGTAEPSSAVTVYRNGSRVATLAADGYGNWSFASGNLGDGLYAFTAQATDPAGNVGPVSASLLVTVDTRAPAAPVITGITPDSGLAGDGITNARQVQFLGTAEPNATVAVSVNGRAVGTATADAVGNWAFDNRGTNLSAGTYALTATATDAAGNVSSASHTYALVVALTPPAKPILAAISPDTGASATDGVTSSRNFTLSGTAVANGTVSVYFNGAFVGTAAVAGNGNWAFAYAGPALADGSYAVTATATDTVGNTSDRSAPLRVVVDGAAPAAPAVTGFSPDSGVAGDGITNGQTPTVAGTAEPGSTVTLYRNGSRVATLAADGRGSWSYASGNLEDGSYAFTATATDPAGNVGPASAPLYFTIDTHAPAAPVVAGITPDSGLAGDGVTNARQVQFLGTAEANATVAVSVNGKAVGTAVADGAGNWVFDYRGTTLSAGSYALTATASDAAGNVSSVGHSYALVVALTAPAKPVLAAISPDTGASSTDRLTSSRAFGVSGTAVANGTVSVYYNGAFVGTAAVAGNGTWAFAYAGPALADGSYAVTATATDTVGNTSYLSSALAVVLDGTAPAAPVVLGFSPDNGVAGDGITNTQAPTVSSTAEPGSTVTVYRNGSRVGTVSADSHGNWSYASGNLGDGSYAFTATATDPAGNVGPASAPLNITIDTKISSPRLTAISPDTGLKNDDEITQARNIVLSGTADANSTVRLFRDGTAIGTAVADGSGNWTFNYTGTTLADGTFNFTAQASDVAGNVSSLTGNFPVIVDNVAAVAVIAGVSKSVDANNVATLTLSGTAEQQGRVQVLLNGIALGTANADGNGKWHYDYKPPTLPNGTYSFTTIDTDAAGNVSAASANYKLLLGGSGLNAGRPKLAGASILGTAGDGTPICSTTPTLTGTTQAGYLVTIVDGNTVLGTAVANSKGQWTFVCPTLARGRHNITVTVTDTLGNTGLLSDVLTFQV